MEKTDIETIIHTEEGVRLSVSNFDCGVWLGLQLRGASAHTVLTREEARKVMEGLQAVLDSEVPA